MTNLKIIEMQKISDKPNPAPTFSVGNGSGSPPLGRASKRAQEGVQYAPPGTPGGARFTPALKSKFFYGGTRKEDSRHNSSDFGSFKVGGTIDEYVKKEKESAIEALPELAVLTSIIPVDFLEDLTTALVGIPQEVSNL